MPPGILRWTPVLSGGRLSSNGNSAAPRRPLPSGAYWGASYAASPCSSTPTPSSPSRRSRPARSPPSSATTARQRPLRAARRDHGLLRRRARHLRQPLDSARLRHAHLPRRRRVARQRALAQGARGDGSAHIGSLLTRPRRACPVVLDVKELVSTHLAIIASTGAGKSYLASVILEELMSPTTAPPCSIIDPHGEYSTLQELPNFRAVRRERRRRPPKVAQRLRRGRRAIARRRVSTCTIRSRCASRR